MADVPAQLRSWSVTAGSNSPGTNTVVGAGLAPNLQQIQATVRQGLLHIGSSVVCAATTDLSTVDGYTIPLSGSATVTSFGTEAEGIRYQLMFSGSPLLKNSTAIQTPTATSGDLSIVSGDIIEVVSQGSGNWKVADAYQPNPRFATISANSLNVSAISGLSGDSLNVSALSAGPISASVLTLSAGASINGSVVIANVLTANTTGNIIAPSFESSESSVISAGSVLTVPHGLGAVPRFTSTVIRCKTAELGYSVNDEIDLAYNQPATSSFVWSVFSDASNIGIVMGTIGVQRKDTQIGAAITPSSWRYVFRAWK